MSHAIATWIELSRAYAFATSFRERYDLWYSSPLLEIMATTTSALDLIIADCTIVHIVYHWDYCSYWLLFRSGVVGLCGLTIGE